MTRASPASAGAAPLRNPHGGAGRRSGQERPVSARPAGRRGGGDRSTAAIRAELGATIGPSRARRRGGGNRSAAGIGPVREQRSARIGNARRGEREG